MGVIYAITIEDVRRDLIGVFSDQEVASFIDFADEADACMEGKGVPHAIGQRLKVLFVRHMLTMGTGSGSGAATSVSSASGASKSFASRDANSTGFSDALKDLDRWGCVQGLLRRPVLSIVFRGANI